MTSIFDCPNCGPQKQVLFDASYVEERAFEGLWFDILKLNDLRGPHDPEGFVVQSQEKDEKYLKAFNMDVHLKSARELIEEGSGIVCPACLEPIE